MLAFPLYGWPRSVRKQVQKGPKAYFFDLGVLNAIRRELNLEINPHSKRTGKLFESFIIQEIFRINSYLKDIYKLYYWRTNSGEEVDLVMQKSVYDDLIAVEIKISDVIYDDDLRNLIKFRAEESKSRLYVFCNTNNSYEKNGVKIIPWMQGIKEIFY